MRATGEGKEGGREGGREGEREGRGREGREKGLTSLELLSFSNSLLTFTKYSKKQNKGINVIIHVCTCNRIKLPQLNYLPMALP